MPVAGEVISVVIAAIVIAIGSLVFYQVMSNLPVLNPGLAETATSAAYNTTQTNIRTNANTAFTLLAIGLLISGAIAILVIVVQKLGWLGGGGGIS